MDETKREYYYVDKNRILAKGIETLSVKLQAKIPFASYLFPTFIDEWGREETYGNC